jgi:hypothetical protein
LYEIQQEGYANEDDLDTILFNAVCSTVSKWWAFKLRWWMQKLCQSVWEHEILNADRSSKRNNFCNSIFCEKPEIQMWSMVES